MDLLHRNQRRGVLESDYNWIKTEHQQAYNNLEGLTKVLGYRFRDQTLLFEALTHRSAVMETSVLTGSANLPTCYERLEFLGDAVLGLAVSHRLMSRKEDFVEGELSRIRAAMVCEENLAKLARNLNLGTYMIVGRGLMQGGGGIRDSILADVLEALIGAVFEDSGFSEADQVVERLFGEFLQGDLQQYVTPDYKTKLQELTQKHNKMTPTYKVIRENGPDHQKTFEVAVLIGAKEFGRGFGASKKRASQEAAQESIARFLDGLSKGHHK